MSWNNDTIRRLERESIHEFIRMAGHTGNFTGRVLDWGCGKQPYRELVESFGAEYHGYDRPDFLGSTVDAPVGGDELLLEDWDVVLCNQVIQYVDNPFDFLVGVYAVLKQGGAIVITWPTCWDEIEPDDKWRYTEKGMRRLLQDVGFYKTVTHKRATIELGGFRFSLGGGAVARK